jgi:hypothetical protein
MILRAAVLTVFSWCLGIYPGARGYAGPRADSGIRTLPVCEALAHSAQYNGKIVRIRGRVFGTDEGTWFVSNDCPGVFVTDGKVWPSNIAWTSPEDLTFILHPVDFTFDKNSLKRIDSRWRRLRKQFTDKCLEVTYTGMFESWSKDGATKRDPKGHKYRINGFGHLNSAPAQLVLKSADDVTPIPNCKPGK